METCGTIAVAPLVGAWIEIFFDVNIVVFDLVAPLVGAWIEIWNQYRIFYDPNMSLPSWERGLKFALEQVKDKEEPSLPSWERGLKYLH